MHLTRHASVQDTQLCTNREEEVANGENPEQGVHRAGSKPAANSHNMLSLAEGWAEISSKQ